MTYSSTVKILKEANLSCSHFANLVGVSRDSLEYYICGRNARPETVKKIAAGIVAIKEADLVWPDIHYIPNQKCIKEYEKNKKKSDRLDKKFTTAYKKALKKAGL